MIRVAPYFLRFAGRCDSHALDGDTLLLMNKAVVTQSASGDAQYQAEAESFGAQLRLLNEQSERDWKRIEQLRTESQANLARIEALVARRETR